MTGACPTHKPNKGNHNILESIGAGVANAACEIGHTVQKPGTNAVVNAVTHAVSNAAKHPPKIQLPFGLGH